MKQLCKINFSILAFITSITVFEKCCGELSGLGLKHEETVEHLESEVKIHCYQCHSDLEPDCEELRLPASTSLLLPCGRRSNDSRHPPMPTFCRKIVQKVYDRKGRQEVTIRSCGWVRHQSQECYRVRNYDHRETVCQCFHDGCNSSPPPPVCSSHAALLTSLALAVLSHG